MEAAGCTACRSTPGIRPSRKQPHGIGTESVFIHICHKAARNVQGSKKGRAFPSFKSALRTRYPHERLFFAQLFIAGHGACEQCGTATRLPSCEGARRPSGYVMGREGHSSFPCGIPESDLRRLGCCQERGGEASFVSRSAFRAQNLTPEDLTEVVVTHLRTEEDPPPELKLPPPDTHILPLPEEKPPLYIPPPMPQLPPELPPPKPPPTPHTPPPIPPPMPLPPKPPPMPLPPKPPPMPPRPPEMVVLPTTAGREAQVMHGAMAHCFSKIHSPLRLHKETTEDTYRHSRWTCRRCKA